MQIHNSFVWCFFYIFSGVTLTDQVELLNAITGWEMGPKEIMEIGERITNLQRGFNVKMAITKKDDVLPNRLMTPHKGGGAQGRMPPMAAMMEEFYAARDWVNGIPSKKKLLELKLEEVSWDLY